MAVARDTFVFRCAKDLSLSSRADMNQEQQEKQRLKRESSEEKEEVEEEVECTGVRNRRIEAAAKSEVIHDD